jgi:uncharacterized protein (TIGR00251 family)
MPVDSSPFRRQLDESGELILDVAVIPRASASEVSQVMSNGTVKIKVMAPPEKGKANDEVCAVLAAFLSLPRHKVEVIQGHTSRHKRVRISRL